MTRFDPRHSSFEGVLDALLAAIAKRSRNIEQSTEYRQAVRYRDWEKRARDLASKIGTLLADPNAHMTPELNALLWDAADTWSDISPYWIRTRYYLTQRGIVWPEPTTLPRARKKAKDAETV